MKNAIITTIEQQIKNLAIEAFKNSESEKLNAEEFIEQFEKLCCTEVEKKTKKKRAPVIIPDSERCQALKKDKTRCSARAYLNGKNPKICTLHNNKGTNYGFVVTQEEEKEGESESEDQEQKELFGESDEEEIF